MGRHAMVGLAFVGALLALAGCRPKQFDDLENDAPIVVFEAPEDFVGGQFGKVVAAYTGKEADGTLASRVIAGGGAETSFGVYSVWDDGLQVSGPFLQGCNTASQECARSTITGEGTSFAGIPVYATVSNPMQPEHMCVLVPLPPTYGPKLLCESTPEVLWDINTGLMNIGLGASAVGLGEGNPIGYALLGAPLAGMGRGGVFVLARDGMATAILPTDELDLTAANLTATASAGSKLAATQVGADTWMATTAPGMQRVVVARLSDDGMGGVTTTVLGCLDDPTSSSAPFGTDVALGDVNGDGTPDVAVGSGVAFPEAGMPQADAAPVVVYDGTGLTGAIGCAMADASDDAAPLATIECAGALDGMRDVRCDGSAFGRPVAFGDLNANGRSELLIGASLARVGGKAEAGAVYVVPFDATGSPQTDGVDVLVHSSPEEHAELGASLTTVQTDLEGTPRDEPVVGMPGTDAFGIFLCSGIDGDTTAVGSRCIP